LTRREREILTLAAQGLSNGDRQRVVLTVGTIEGHLSHASVKLGISDAPHR
jgi:ATP/maltotriose-dependent transcriptional regulator MalT